MKITASMQFSCQKKILASRHKRSGKKSVSSLRVPLRYRYNRTAAFLSARIDLFSYFAFLTVKAAMKINHYS